MFDNNGDVKDGANCLTSLKNSPQIPRSIDDNSPSGSVVDYKQTNKFPRFAGKEEALVIKRNNDKAFLNDISKVVDMNVCINNQSEVSFIAKNDTIENKRYDGISLVKNVA